MKINQPISQQEQIYNDEIEIISTTDLKGRLLSANEDFIKISGYTSEDLIGNNHNMVRHPDVPPEAFHALWTNLKQGKPWLGFLKNRCENGDHYWVDAYVSPQYIDNSINAYQSVRVKPKEEQISRATKLYQKMMEKKSDSDKKKSKISEIPLGRFRLSLVKKFNLLFSAILIPIMALFTTLGILPYWMAISGVAIGIIIFAIGTRSLLKILIKEAETARRIVDDPMAQWLYTGSNDEVGTLAFSRIYTHSKLRTAMGRLKESSDVLIRTSREIAQGGNDLSARTEEQAASLEETAASMEELTSSVNQSSENTARASKVATEASSKAEQGGELIERTIEAMQEINHSSQQIADIIGVVDEIAFQTNLLALNASVEAARAGEQGRGFAVVAAEVRNLAQRSAESAKEIKELISESLQRVATGSELVNDSGETLKEIVASITEVNNLVNEIASTSREQALGINQVNAAISQMDEITQHNAALVEESASASEELVSKVKLLDGLAHQFKIDDGEK